MHLLRVGLSVKFSILLDKNNLEVSVSMIQDLFFKVANKTISRKPKKIYGSRLDHPLIPNCLTKLIRKTLSSDLW